MLEMQASQLNESLREQSVLRLMQQHEPLIRESVAIWLKKRGFGRRTDMIDDCVQQVWIVAWKSMKVENSTTQQELYWLRKISLNVVGGVTRKARLRTKIEGDTQVDQGTLENDVTVHDALPEDHVHEWIDYRRREIDGAMQKLEPRSQRFLAQYFLDGMTLQQIAALEGIHHGNISRDIHKSLEALRKHLRHVMEVEGN